MAHRRYKDTKDDHTKNNIIDEVDRLFKKYKHGISQSDFTKLSNPANYNNNFELANKIQEAYLATEALVTKKAKKVARVIKEKYGNQNLPYHYLLEKVLQFKYKYKFSDSVFARFQEITEQELIGSKSTSIIIPSTKMMKTLGYINMDYGPTNQKLSDIDYKCIQEIIKINALTKQIYTQAIIQSYNYKLSNIYTQLQTFRPELGHSNTGALVHPVIAALFLDKNKTLDSHFIYSNLANIVEKRYKNEPLQYWSDIKLFNALVRDTNDIVCNSVSPYMDLLTRVKIQHNLWDCVINLREGRIYNRPTFTNLLVELSNCSIMSFEEQSLIFGNTDGIILRRLLGTFSFKPTSIYSLPITTGLNTMTTYDINPFQQHMKPIVTNIPIVHIKLTPNTMFTQNKTIDLMKSLDQKMLLIEHGKMVMKQTNIIYSHGVIFFYVDRRKISLNPMGLKNINLNIESIPPSIMASYESFDDSITVNYLTKIEINKIEYNLKSVILAETLHLPSGQEIMLNSSTLIYTEDPNNIGGTNVLKYDPIGLNILYNNDNKPILNISNMGPINTKSREEEAFEKYGLIYMYTIDPDAEELYKRKQFP